MKSRLEAERLAQEIQTKKNQHEEEEDDEPYVAPKKLEKKLAKFGQNTQSEIQKAMEMAKRSAKEELKQEMWLENNPDFYDVLQHAEKFAQRSPKLAESILRMPEETPIVRARGVDLSTSASVYIIEPETTYELCQSFT